MVNLPLDARLRVGIQTIHRRTEPAVGPWLPTIAQMREIVTLVDRCGYDSLWVGDHISFPVSIFKSEEHTSELQSLMRISYAVFCLKKKNQYQKTYQKQF